MKWLDVVKKHIKLNPGKSIKDLMPDIKAEYYKLSGKPKTKVVKKKSIKNKTKKNKTKKRKNKKR